MAFARSNDRHHGWAVNIAKRITEPLLTCEAVWARLPFNLNPVRMYSQLLSPDNGRIVHRVQP